MKENKTSKLFFVIPFIFILILCLLGEFSAACSMIILVVAFLPAFWVSIKSKYFSLKLYISIAYITLMMTTPVFYLLSERYAFSDYRPFNFNPADAIPILFPLGLFLFFLSILARFFERYFYFAKHNNYESFSDESVNRVNNLNSVFYIYLLIIVSLPIKLAMFKSGIGIVGVLPPSLPFKLSGILTYLFGIIVPLFIGYFYIQTKRNSLFLVMIIAVYSLLIGISSASKSVTLYALAPIVAYAYLDKRRVIFIISSVLAGIGVTFASASRELTHISNGLVTEAYTSLGAFETLRQTIINLDWTTDIFLVYIKIAGRIEGFQGILLSSRFNSNSIGGGWPLFFNSISHGLLPINHDMIHLEYLGYTIPYGFYGVAASLNSWMLMASNSNVFMMLPFLLYAALTLIILEKAILKISSKYKIQPRLTKAFIFLITLWFYTGPGTREFQVMFFLALTMSILPKFNLSIFKK